MSVFDENRNGRLDPAERSDQREFQTGDRNHDGGLNRAEYGRVDNPADFTRADTNRDGIVDAPEFAREEFAERGGGGGGFGGGGYGGAGGYGGGGGGYGFG